MIVQNYTILSNNVSIEDFETYMGYMISVIGEQGLYIRDHIRLSLNKVEPIEDRVFLMLKYSDYLS